MNAIKLKTRLTQYWIATK